MPRIHVRNFQSLKDLTLDVEGFTAVTGLNNSGKTAVVRAVAAAFSNPPVGPYLRHGEDTCSVSVTFADQQQVQWSKGTKDKPQYNITRQTAEGLVTDKIYPGREVPSEVQALGVSSIEVGTQTVWPQIASQFSGQIFLLDQSGAVVAETIADVDRVGSLTDALRLCESDRKGLKSALEIRKTDLKGTEERLAFYTGLEDVEGLLEPLAQQEVALAEVVTQREQLERVQEQWTLASGVVTSLQGVVSVPVPEVKHLGQLADQLGESLRLQMQWGSAEAQVNSLKGVDTVTLPESSVAKVAALVPQVEKLAASYTATSQQVAHWQPVLRVEIPSPPENTQLVELARLAAQWKQATKAHELLAEPVPALPDTVRLEQMRRYADDLIPLAIRMHTANRAVVDLQSSLEAVAAQEAALRRDQGALLAQHKTCPACERAL